MTGQQPSPSSKGFWRFTCCLIRTGRVVWRFIHAWSSVLMRFDTSDSFQAEDSFGTCNYETALTCPVLGGLGLQYFFDTYSSCLLHLGVIPGHTVPVWPVRWFETGIIVKQLDIDRNQLLLLVIHVSQRHYDPQKIVQSPRTHERKAHSKIRSLPLSTVGALRLLYYLAQPTYRYFLFWILLSWFPFLC